MQSQLWVSLVYSYEAMVLLPLRLLRHSAEMVPQVADIELVVEDILTVLVLMVVVDLQMNHPPGPIHLDIQHLSVRVVLELLILQMDFSLPMDPQLLSEPEFAICNITTSF